MRVLVCGGRDFNNVPALWRALDELRDKTPEPGITWLFDGASDEVTGPYVGADYWAHQWALARRISTCRFPAKWKSQGRAAGPIRNARMLTEGQPDFIIAFPGGRGTADMVSKARAAGVKVIEINP